MVAFSTLTAINKGKVLKALVADNTLIPNRVTGGNIGNQNGISGLPSKPEIVQLKRILGGRGLLDAVGISVASGVPDDLIGGINIVGGAISNVSNPAFNTDLERELGYLRSNEKADREITAISNPIQFLKDAQADILSINQRALGAYGEAYDFAISRGFPREESQSKAKSAATSFRNKLMEQHNADFKSSELTAARGRIKQNIAV